RRAARRFGSDPSGNIAITFALALIPILTFVGAAVDYSRANAAHSAMQSALDTTALMLSRDISQGTITTANLTTAANNYFKALYTSKDAPNPTVTVTYATNTSTGSNIILNASGSITTDFMKIAGFPTMGFNASSTTAWGNVKMRVALALDNTGSMAQDNKLPALKNAVAGSGGLIDQLSNLAKTPGDVYISVIPFAKVVNVGATNNYAQNWIDWTDWLNPPTTQPNNGSYQANLPINWHAVGPKAKCPFTSSNSGFTCVASPTSTSGQSYIPSSGTYSGYICPSVDANSHTKYNGCWVSTLVSSTPGVFCSGSNSCSCPVDSSGNAVSQCSCTGTGSSKSCTGLLYDHNWTQPGPNDTADNTNQPRVNAVVGWTYHKYTSSNPTATVVNAWNAPSTNPISSWTGCITDRSQPNDATTVQPSGTYDMTTLFPANEYYENSESYCASNNSPQLEPIIPLSYDWSSLKTAINAMQPTGGTNQAVGLAWAAQSLIPSGILNAPAEDSNTTYNRVIIILSDGLNTEDRWPDNGNGSTQAAGTPLGPIDTRQELLCSNLKNAKDSKGNYLYTIYAIQVNTHTPADATSKVLSDCASGSDKFFMLTSSTQILTTFQTIGTALSKLRVAK
ncbi:MAG: TadE/TadG family type IV pilus assembly protein, partial [Bradyrhizobium sp.]|uniref:TadE/TadG family type IV pilus assembly protein n=1 Tax=Bradyrhizobium sp. TaxID=376 RepID=UPI003C7C6303